MPDNPQNTSSRTPVVETGRADGIGAPADSGWFALPDHAVLALEGRDAVAFAQAQLMNDVVALAEGGWHWTGWLTPKGRVVALFALLRPAPDTVWLLVPDADPSDLAERLRRFVFRSKLTLRVRTDLHVCGRFAPAGAVHAGDEGGTTTDGRNGRILALPDGGLVLDMSGDGGPRSLRISAETAPPAPAAVADWRRCDLIHGWPRLDATQREQWTPQQLSLDRLRAFSVKKGCYPGQEIVARTHFLGQAKRGLALVETDDALQAGDTLRERDDTDAAVLGTVVCAEGLLALAVLPLPQEARDEVGGAIPPSPDTTRPALGGASWRRVAMAGGLAR